MPCRVLGPRWLQIHHHVPLGATGELPDVLGCSVLLAARASIFALCFFMAHPSWKERYGVQTHQYVFQSVKKKKKKQSWSLATSGPRFVIHPVL